MRLLLQPQERPLPTVLLRAELLWAARNLVTAHHVWRE